MVGLIPLFDVETLEPETIARMPGFQRRMQWFLDNMPDFASHVDASQTSANGPRRLLSLVDRNQLVRILGYMVDKEEFYSSHGIRALSKFHAAHPYILAVNGSEHRVDYEPAESQSGVFGGNSNWRGPVWFPTNFLMIESLQKFHHYYGDGFRVECPSGSGQQMSLWDVSAEISRSLTHIFLRDENGRRPVYGSLEKFQNDPWWRDLILFYEYFHGDNGTGLGASHQTGWTGLVAGLIKLFNTLRAEDVLERGLHAAVSAVRKAPLTGGEKTDVHATTLHDPLARQLVTADWEVRPQTRR